MNRTENRNKIKGRVCVVQRNLFTVKSEVGEVNAHVKGTFYKTNSEFPVIGDYVIINYNPMGDSVIEEICKRKSVFTRPDMLGHAAGYVKTIKEQVLAANMDYVFIVTSLNQNYNLNRITRYVTVAIQGGATPIVILTKADLCMEVNKYLSEVKNISDQVSVHAISAINGQGMEQLEPYLQNGITIALLGSSGVGKSTLLNTIAGEELMKVSEIRESDSKGHHTTTHRQLIELPSGVTIIDMPGIRELGMCNVDDGIDDTFSDITELISSCKFGNCRHQTEPGCAVKRALLENSLSVERWGLYSKLQNENAWGNSKLEKTRSLK